MVLFQALQRKKKIKDTLFMVNKYDWGVLIYQKESCDKSSEKYNMKNSLVLVTCFLRF